MKSVDYIELNALAIIYSCTIGQVHLLVYYIKLKICPSVRLRHGIISVVSAWIDLGLGLCIAGGLRDMNGRVS